MSFVERSLLSSGRGYVFNGRFVCCARDFVIRNTLTLLWLKCERARIDDLVQTSDQRVFLLCFFARFEISQSLNFSLYACACGEHLREGKKILIKPSTLLVSIALSRVFCFFIKLVFYVF